MNSKLIGKKIKALFVSPGEQCLKFVTDSEPIYWLVDGDCCSESWFADIAMGVWGSSLKDGKVEAVEEIPLPAVDDKRSRQEFDAVYAYTIKTEKGFATVIFRNSSNGYYGGALYEKDEEPKGKEWKEEPKGMEWKAVDLKEDWHAPGNG